MPTIRRTPARTAHMAFLAAVALLAGVVPLARVAPVRADTTPQLLPFSQAWTSTGQIVANDDWSSVPGVTGYLGQDITVATGVNPATLLTESAALNDVDVIANQTGVDLATGGVAEFELADPVVAFQGSGTADAPYLLLSFATTGYVSVRVAYRLRDLDGTADNAIQPVALQYRVGSTGNFTNVAPAFVADATSGPFLATLVTNVDVGLPSIASNRPLIQVRIITSNAVGSDEWVGVDDIAVTALDRAPSVQSNVPSNGATDVAVGANLAVTFSEPVTVTAPWFSLSCPSVGAQAATFSGGPTTFTIDPGVDLPPNAACQVVVLAARVSDQDADDPPDTMNSSASFGFTTGGIQDAAPAVSSTVPGNGAAGVALDASPSVTFSEPVNVTEASFAIACATSGSHIATVSGGPVTFTLDSVADFGPSELCAVTVVAANVTDQDLSDPPNSMTADHVFSFTTTTGCGSPATAIHDIQGSGPASPLVGHAVEIEGVVVGDFQPSTSFNGFHVQEEDSDTDSDPATSEGVFVFEGASTVDVAAGDVVRVQGTVVEFNSGAITLTELASVTRVLLCAGGAAVTPSQVALPFATTSVPERYEGMLIETTQDLTVSETFGLGRFGELVLSSGGRLLNPTHVVEPGPAAQAMQAANDRNRIVLDDGDNRQNLDPTAYPAGGLSASGTLRVGDTVRADRFVLEQRFGVYRLQPVEAIEVAATNPRPAAPPAVGGDLRVAALNALNYFTTLNTGPGGCGPAGTLDCRGANSILELERQRAKTVAEIIGLDADVLGLMEIQNDTGATLADLVGALNAATAPGTYAAIDTGTIGADAIKVAILYRPAAVAPVGAHAILDNSVDPRFIDTLNRPALAQTFDAVGGGRLTVVVNHLKSKGSACPGDPDLGDGQGNCSQTRTAAARALVDWIASDPTGSGDLDTLVVGDLNSYAQEDPIDAFTASGYANLIDAFGGAGSYSYVFGGQTGYLDHALASPSLAAQVTGTAQWHVNADEPAVLDYNVEFKSAGHVSSLFAPGPYRSSDHDPVVVGMDLLDFGFSGFRPPVEGGPLRNVVKAGQTVPIKFVLGRGADSVFGLDHAIVAIASRAFVCASGVPIGEAERIASPGRSALNPDPATGIATYLWKTNKAWANQCRTFSLTLADGTIRHAAFDFRR